MKAYSIFDDFGNEPARILQQKGIQLTVHPLGMPRPSSVEMRAILKEFDCIIIGTSQKISAEMFDDVNDPRIIATASVGKDHIIIPEDKRELVTVLNAPKANVQSVAEFTMGCALSCCKRLSEGAGLYTLGENNKKLKQKPDDLHGKTMGVVGAGSISARIMEFAVFFGMKVLCWTAHPENHRDLLSKGVTFTSLEDLVKEADVISVNLPDNDGTRGLMSKTLVQSMKEDAIFISVSRISTVDWRALLFKAEHNSHFYVCMDIDVEKEICNQLTQLHNIIITPHIAGGTVKSRNQMFLEVANQVAALI